LAGPRLGILVWWLFNPIYIRLAFNSWLWPLLGWFFLPWTTLMYIAIYPRGIIGFDWLWLGMAVFADMATYLGGYRERERVPYGEMIP
jgi:hypothetical protein